MGTTKTSVAALRSLALLLFLGLALVCGYDWLFGRITYLPFVSHFVFLSQKDYLQIDEDCRSLVADPTSLDSKANEVHPFGSGKTWHLKNGNEMIPNYLRQLAPTEIIVEGSQRVGILFGTERDGSILSWTNVSGGAGNNRTMISVIENAKEKVVFSRW